VAKEELVLQIQT